MRTEVTCLTPRNDISVKICVAGLEKKESMFATWDCVFCGDDEKKRTMVPNAPKCQRFFSPETALEPQNELASAFFMPRCDGRRTHSATRPFIQLNENATVAKISNFTQLNETSHEFYLSSFFFLLEKRRIFALVQLSLLCY